MHIFHTVPAILFHCIPSFFSKCRNISLCVVYVCVGGMLAHMLLAEVQEDVCWLVLRTTVFASVHFSFFDGKRL